MPSEFTVDETRFAGNDAPVRTHVHAAPGGKIFEIQINRPEMHNSVNGAAADLLLEAWSRFRDDDSLVVAILHGAGDRAFCSGADLTALEELVDPQASPADREAAVQNGTGPMGGSRIVQLKPVITVTQGYTYAGGLELFCHGHIRIAEKQALFSVACRRWGVPLVDGGTVYLPRLLGQAQALPLILTGQRIRAQRAYDIGLVWELTAKGRGLKRAFRVAEQLCAQPRDAMLADLASVVDGAHLGMEDALRLEARNIDPVVKSDSFKQGVARFNRGDRFWFL
ncbi:MAG: enoyl-CoA hydratase-related protein [Leptospirales bacterium]